MASKMGRVSDEGKEPLGYIKDIWLELGPEK